jgi:DAACS family dicarboxylate/amino acid:cation (Na+ or H+) symporter
MPLHTRILIGLVLGAALGAIAQTAVGAKNPQLVWFNDVIAQNAGKVFLYLIFMIVVPLLFSALVLGVGELGNAARVGKIGMLSLLMTVILSGTAVLIGLGAVNLVRPGERIPEAQRVELRAQYSNKEQGEKQLEAAKKEPEDPPLIGFIPRNPFKEIVRALDGGLLPVMFFALFFGLALSAVEAERAAPLRAFFDSLFAVSQKVVEYAMSIAPYGVFFLVFRTAASLGAQLFVALGTYVVLVLAALAIHQFGTYSLALKYIAKMSPTVFFRKMKAVMLTAFGTSSSNATLPLAMKTAEEEIGLPRDVGNFVLTVGATANQNGTALFEGITIVFLAQLFGVHLDFLQQLTVMGLAILAGIGTAGVPGGSLPMIASVLVMFKIPAEAIGVILGVDRILDMSRTVLNVTGDMTIAACVTRLSGRQGEALTDTIEATS